MNVVQFRPDVPQEVIVKELLADADDAMKVDCASSRVGFAVIGWFVFPKGSLVHTTVTLGA